MKKLMELKDVIIEKQETILLNKISLPFYEGLSTFICGTSASGKTTLLKTIKGVMKYKGHITKYDKVEVVLEEENHKEVVEELEYESLTETQKKIVDKWIKKSLLEKKKNEVTEEEWALIALTKAFIQEPKLLVIDSIFDVLSEKNRKKLFSYAKRKSITLVCVSTNIELALDFDYMIVLDKGSIAIEGKTLQVLEQEKVLKRLGIGLPFYVDLSIQLKLYGLVQEVYLTKEDLRGALWK